MALGVAAIVVANLLGGISYLWQKLALAGLPPATVIVLRNAVALACMAAWLRFRGPFRWPYTRRETGRLFLVGNLAYAAPLLLGIVGVDLSTSTNGSILILLEPASILFFSWLLLRERIRGIQLVGILVGLAGALLIVAERAPLDDLLAGRHALGNAILAGHGLLWGLYSPLVKPLADKYREAVSLTFAPMLLANALLLPAALAESQQWHAGPDLAAALLWTLVLGVAVSFASTVLWTLSLTRLRASSIAPFVFLQPLAGVAAGWAVLAEAPTAEALGGGILIALGVLAVLSPAWRRR